MHVWPRYLNFVRGPRPERVILTEHELCHVPSTLRTFRNLVQLRRPLREAKNATLVQKHRISSLTLATARGRQQLVFNDGVRSIEIGRSLENSEREWLADVILKWANDTGYR